MTDERRLREAADYIRQAARLLDRACNNPEVCKAINALPENEYLNQGFADAIDAIADCLTNNVVSEVGQ